MKQHKKRHHIGCLFYFHHAILTDDFFKLILKPHQLAPRKRWGQLVHDC